MRQNDSLAVVIVAKNEAARIRDCVASAAFADEMLVLDSGSSDPTAAIAARPARASSSPMAGLRPAGGARLHAGQSDWVLSLDADERVTPALQAEIRGRNPAGASTATASRAGRSSAAASCTTGAGGPTARCASAGARQSGFTDDFLHAHMTVDGRIGDLDQSLIHHSYPDVHDVLEKLDRYSSGSARDMHARGRIGEPGKAIAHGLFAFVRTYC